VETDYDKGFKAGLKKGKDKREAKRQKALKRLCNVYSNCDEETQKEVVIFATFLSWKKTRTNSFIV